MQILHVGFIDEQPACCRLQVQFIIPMLSTNYKVAIQTKIPLSLSLLTATVTRWVHVWQTPSDAYTFTRTGELPDAKTTFPTEACFNLGFETETSEFGKRMSCWKQIRGHIKPFRPGQALKPWCNQQRHSRIPTS